ncbi:hypothetical protein E1258_07470 [Micromonospora sp. KC207]|uniref:hypothetical protein n=1 Tax=Micromonospora sp. KC207 TaxID=2530377 RepID=UPI00104C6301|nr:hypothetical protein [Micromonospora sp. KC207]TDC64731.1 hypothetical protein E1258_07470 [Micromonospora sp. KC207]
MRLPARIANPVLAVLIQHSGFNSLDEFATAVNELGRRAHGLRLSYDHVAVKRWLAGGGCQQPQVVAEVLSHSWNVPIPAAVIWPQLRQGGPPAPPHTGPCVAARTLDDLAAHVGSDMLTRRSLLTDAIDVAVGTALTDPLLQWLNGPTVGLSVSAESASRRLSMATVANLEMATDHFREQDAAIGGGLSREAAVGQLKHAIDMVHDGSYTDAVGNRMLAAVAELAGMVGWMSHDVGMDGPAQRYFTLGLQAATASTHPRSLLLRVNLLADMARQMSDLDQPATGLRMVEAALDLLPQGTHPAAAAMLWNLKARMLAPLGPSSVPEIRHATALAVDLLARAPKDGDNVGRGYLNAAELAGNAALAWQDAAAHTPTLARHAQEQALIALTHRPGGYSRSLVFDQISLAAARFSLTQIDQAAADGQTALDLAVCVPTSARVLDRLRTLGGHCAAYADNPAVRDFRDRLTLVLRRADA